MHLPDDVGRPTTPDRENTLKVSVSSTPERMLRSVTPPTVRSSTAIDEFLLGVAVHCERAWLCPGFRLQRLQPTFPIEDPGLHLLHVCLDLLGFDGQNLQFLFSARNGYKIGTQQVSSMRAENPRPHAWCPPTPHWWKAPGPQRLENLSPPTGMKRLP